MQCNRDFTSCSGDGELHIASGMSWRGRIAMRNGRLVPESADLWNRTRTYAAPDGTVPGTDLRLASCSSFSGPLQCSDGEFEYPSGNRFEGGWTLRGVAFERASASAAPGYRLDGDVFESHPVRRVCSSRCRQCPRQRSLAQGGHRHLRATLAVGEILACERQLFAHAEGLSRELEDVALFFLEMMVHGFAQCPRTDQPSG